MKDSGFRIRVQKDLRERFVQVCRSEDKPAAQVLREFMRHYVKQHENAGEREQLGSGSFETTLGHKLEE